MKHDITNVVSAFLNNMYPERPELMREFTSAIMKNRALLALVSEVGVSAFKNGLQPIDVLRLGLVYGMAVGVMLERDRTMREKRVI